MTACWHRPDLLVAGIAAVALVFAVPAARAQHEPVAVTDKALADAQELFKAGKWDEARAAFQKFETQFKFSTGVPIAIYYQGLCAAGAKRHIEAIQTFERLFRAFPNAPIIPEATLKQAESYRELGNLNAALASYRAFQSRWPKHDLLPQAAMGEAWTLYKQKNYNEAKRVLQTVREQFGGDPVIALDALFLIGQVLNDEKNFDGAREIYKQIAASRDPRATEGLLLAGESSFDAKRFADAINYYKRVQSKAALLAGIDDQIAALRAEIPKRIGAGQAVGQLQTRIETLQTLATEIRQRPDLRALALFRTANCYQSLGKPEEASLVYRHFLRLFPVAQLPPQQKALVEKAHYGLIQTLTERGQLNEADAEARAFEKKYPNSTLSADAAFLQAETLFGTEQYDEAIQRYQKFRAASKNAQLNETADFRVASALHALKRYEQARDAFTRFLLQYPQGRFVADALFGKGRAHFELSQNASDAGTIQNNLTEAINAFERIRHITPPPSNLPDVTFQLGYLYSYLGAHDKTAFEKSVGAFQDFISRWPEHKNRDDKALAPEATFQLARAQLARGRVDEAVAAYRQLVDRWPANDLAPFASYEVATAYSTANRPQDMVAALRAYAEKYPRHELVGDALYAVGDQLERSRKPDDAIVEYRKLVALAGTWSGDMPEKLRNATVAAQLRVAGILETRGSLDDAIADCQRFLLTFQADPIAVRAMTSQIASMYRKARRYADGYATLDEIAAKNLAQPNIRVAATTSTIELALGEKDYQRAYAAALKLLADPEKDRLPALSYAAAGNALLKTDRHAQARDVFAKMRALYPDDARTAPLALLGLGQAQLGLNQLDDAEASFQQMLRADPANPARPDAELGLAKVWETKGRTKEAVDLYNKVMQAARGETGAEAASRLGNFFFAQKDFKTALAYYLRVALLTAGPMGEEAAFRSGVCHEGLSNIEAARSAYNAYLRRFPTGKFTTEVKQKLQALPAPQPAPDQS
jgi:TolA-binding protein